MASSGTYAFAPSLGQCTIAAFRRIGIRTPTLRQEHFDMANIEMNMCMVTFSNLQPNLWKVSLDTIPLVAGTAVYSIPAKTVLILDAYITTNPGSQFGQNNRYITQLSRTEFASLSNPNTPGPPTQIWFDRLINPTVTFWPVPDNNGPYTFGYYHVDQVQDAALPGGQTPDLPYLFLDAFIAQLAHRLSRMYAPALEQIRAADAEKAWNIAAAQNIEVVNLSLAPPLSRFYPR
jgi:hypothetical protein